MSDVNERQEALAKLFGMVNTEAMLVNQNGGEHTAVAQGGNILLNPVSRNEFLRAMAEAKTVKTGGKDVKENKNIEKFAERLIGGSLPSDGLPVPDQLSNAETLEVLKSIDITLKSILGLISAGKSDKV